MTDKELFNRAELLLGSGGMSLMSRAKVLVVGVGGVGSWCAEGLVRSGIAHLTIVDADCVCASNVNRQLMATTLTIGRSKVEAMKERLLQINPHAHITARHEVYTAQTAHLFPLDGYDYIIDAIDSLPDKALLIRNACRCGGKLFSSMGAARKMNPLQISVAEFWKVKGDPLARALRNRFKKSGELPAKKFQCVYSEECLPASTAASDGPGGSLVHITAVFGFMLAGLVVQDIARAASPAGDGAP